jgi:hypothetical protein
MGGYGSGQRYSSRNTTDDHLALDIRRMSREGWLKPGARCVTTWSNRGVNKASIASRANTHEIRLEYRHQSPGKEWESIDYVVRLDRTECHFGGSRVWFICPRLGCGNRTALLYCSRYFVCRHCLALGYQSQRDTPADRNLAKAQAIRYRLCGSADAIAPFPQKPKGMHERTYLRLRTTSSMALHRANWITGQRLGTSTGRSLDEFRSV